MDGWMEEEEEAGWALGHPGRTAVIKIARKEKITEEEEKGRKERKKERRKKEMKEGRKS